MEHKIILELIKKDLNEILSLVETLQEKENPEQLLIDITISKAKTLAKEFELLQGTTNQAKNEPKPDDFVAISTPRIVEETTQIQEDKKEIPFEEEKIERISPPAIEVETKVEVEEINEKGEIENNEPEIIFEKKEERIDLGSEEQIEAEENKAESKEVEIDLKPEELETQAIIEVKAELELEEKIEESKETEIVFEKNNEFDLKPEETQTQAPSDTKAKVEVEEKIEKSKAVEIVIESKNEIELKLEESEIQTPIEKQDSSKIEVEETSSDAKKVLGEQFTKEPSLNERLGTNQPESKIKGKPVTSLKSAIGLNDKFMFTRELFDNKHEKFAQSIDKIDGLSTLMEAIEYLEQNFTWPKNDISLKFMELVKKRFED